MTLDSALEGGTMGGMQDRKGPCARHPASLKDKLREDAEQRHPKLSIKKGAIKSPFRLPPPTPPLTVAGLFGLPDAAVVLGP
jgi:hypothetical protein